MSRELPDAPALAWRRDAAGTADLLAHLRRCDADYVPPLSTRVVLEDYAAKLRARAATLECWAGPGLVGLVAVYLEGGVPGEAFVSDVSVDPAHRGLGIARRLLDDAIALAAAAGKGALVLEVSRGATAALALYAGLGFAEEPGPPSRGETSRLRLRLPSTR